MPEFDLEAVRAQIPALDKSVYMNTGGTGPLPSVVANHIADTYQNTAMGGAHMPEVRVPIKDSVEHASQVSAVRRAARPAVRRKMSKGIELVRGIGLENVEAHARHLTDRLKAALAEIPGATLRSPESAEFSTGIVAFSVDGLRGGELNRQIFERWNVLGRAAIDDTAMRLSCAFFNSDQEIETVVVAISVLANENG